MTSYEQGFLTKCAERGIDSSSAMGLLKLAAKVKRIGNDVWEKLIDRYISSGKGWTPPAVVHARGDGRAVTVLSDAASVMKRKMDAAADMERHWKRDLADHRGTERGLFRTLFGHSKAWRKEEDRLKRWADDAAQEKNRFGHLFDSLKFRSGYGAEGPDGLSRTTVLWEPEAAYNAIMSNTAKDIARAAERGDTGRLQRMISEFGEGTRGGNLKDDSVRLALAKQTLAETILGRLRAKGPARFDVVH